MELQHSRRPDPDRSSVRGHRHVVDLPSNSMSGVLTASGDACSAGHLVDVDTLLDAELRYEHIEGSVQNPNDLGLTNNRAVPLGKVGDQDTEIQVRRLLLSELGRVAFAVFAVSSLSP